MRIILSAGFIMMLFSLFVVFEQADAFANEREIQTADTISKVSLDGMHSESRVVLLEENQSEKSVIVSKDQIAIFMLIVLLGITAFILQYSWGTIRTE